VSVVHDSIALRLCRGEGAETRGCSDASVGFSRLFGQCPAPLVRKLRAQSKPCQPLLLHLSQLPNRWQQHLISECTSRKPRIQLAPGLIDCRLISAVQLKPFQHRAAIRPRRSSSTFESPWKERTLSCRSVIGPSAGAIVVASLVLRDRVGRPSFPGTTRDAALYTVTKLGRQSNSYPFMQKYPATCGYRHPPSFICG
jgi:hypothetical protein